MTATRERDIVHQSAHHWVLRVVKGFEVYRESGTHSVRCARIGYGGERGLEMAKAECARRDALPADALGSPLRFN